ncbi:LSU ribosomal protein L9p [[Mycoplasma] cavipharyngis]|uniref:50S ribosomal protein L9 n=1 Tax=[Mycoplasma] cavipharyngis TaxID=92757 RepID=UPI0037048C9D
MKVFLLEDVVKVGKKHQVVEVKDGFAKNFLFAKKLALIYSEKNKSKIDKILLNVLTKRDEDLLALNLLKQTLDKLQLVFYLKYNETNHKEYHRISHHHIIKELKEKHQLELSKYAFKDRQTFGIGAHQVKIYLTKDVVATLNFTVQASK